VLLKGVDKEFRLGLCEQGITFYEDVINFVIIVDLLAIS
jgi:hypothetical protein